MKKPHLHWIHIHGSDEEEQVKVRSRLQKLITVELLHVGAQ